MRAIGIVRQSKDNDGDSPHAQRARIEDACDRDGMTLIKVHTELDVSGGTPLERRHGLRSAVEAVEAGEADVIVAAYFDRLVRSLRVQDELVSRVEAAGGKVLALDTGQVTNGSAGQWLSGGVLGLVAEYQRRTTAERTAEAQARAVARGVPPWPGAPVGYRRGEDGRLQPDETAPIVAEAFRMRAAGAPIRAVREHLLAHGLSRSFGGVQRALGSRVYLGEIHHGQNINRSAHAPIVDATTWQQVQNVRVPRGRQGTSDRLLARLGVLRCGTCGGRMVVGRSNRGYRSYRCPSTCDCDRRATIAAELVEGLVVDTVTSALADAEGRAAAEDTARQASGQLDTAQAELDALIDMLDPLEPAARRRLAAATEHRDEAREKADRLRGPGGAVVVTGWDDRLTLDERRALIRATVERVTVAPGRGLGRVTVELFGE